MGNGYFFGHHLIQPTTDFENKQTNESHTGKQ